MEKTQDPTNKGLNIGDIFAIVLAEIIAAIIKTWANNNENAIKTVFCFSLSLFAIYLAMVLFKVPVLIAGSFVLIWLLINKVGK